MPELPCGSADVPALRRLRAVRPTCCEVWAELGHGDTCAATIATDLWSSGVEQIRTQAELAQDGALPAWLGDEVLHLSHRSALLRKEPDWYGTLFPGLSDDLPYRWPIRSANAVQAEPRKAERDIVRTERAAARAAQDAERASRRRSQAARRGWKTRRANPDLGSGKP